MKMRLGVALVGLAISVSLPAFAQQKHAADPQISQQLDVLGQQYDAAFNNGDAVALAGIFTEDAVLVTDTGPVYGREAIEKYYADLFKQVHFSNQIGKRDQYSPHIIGTAGNEMWFNGDWSLTYQVNGGGPIRLKGYSSTICVREGDAWKRLLQMSNVTP
jgi:ketosteroid isomerase-like protein